IYHAGDSEEIALAETIHHHQKFMRATQEEPGWTADFRVLVGRIDRELHDVNAVPGVLDPEDYAASQVEGRRLRAAGSDGLTWKSVRRSNGNCIGIFWPDIIPIPVQGRHYSYHWDGTRVDFVRRHDSGEVLAVR